MTRRKEFHPINFTDCTYLYTVVALFVNNRHIGPVHLFNDFHHRFDLVKIAGNRTSEVLETLFVRQLWTGRKERNLKRMTRHKEVSYFYNRILEVIVPQFFNEEAKIFINES